MVAHLSTLKKGRLMSKGAAYLLLAFLAAATFVHASTELDTDASIKDADTLPALPVIPPLGGPDTSPGVLSGDHDFTLRHVFHHGTYKHPRLHRRIDIHPESQVWTAMDEDDTPVPATPLHARSTSTSVQRLVDRRRTTIESLLTDARMSGTATVLSPSAWTIDDIRGPNVTDKETVLSFAKMAANAYVQEPHTGEWEDVGGGYNYTEDFGWEGDGLRGHIFADTANSTVVIGLKGTTPAVFDGAETTTNDKVNDNLFCSCCCAQGGQYLWKQVCDCYSTTYTCNSTCLTRALKSENRYYQAALELYSNVTELYPNSDVWLAGHSLGGAQWIRDYDLEDKHRFIHVDSNKHLQDARLVGLLGREYYYRYDNVDVSYYDHDRDYDDDYLRDSWLVRL
ncbi:MAG: hypothetical protein M1819_000890 [Sarea resinae]|nr:MAG: hypothetical protein M1819_000890 [Sarea resinae]